MLFKRLMRFKFNGLAFSSGNFQMRRANQKRAMFAAASSRTIQIQRRRKTQPNGEIAEPSVQKVEQEDAARCPSPHGASILAAAATRSDEVAGHSSTTTGAAAESEAQ
jgi:hypothetical protein